MTTGTEQRLAEMRRRIDRLGAGVHESAGKARSQMQRDLAFLRRDAATARAAARRETGLVEGELEQLGNELDIAEDRLAAELADDRDEFVDALEAALGNWDIYLERMQARAATTRDRDRASLEEAIAAIRRYRTAAAERLAEVRAARDDGWHDAGTRALAALDDIERRANAAQDDEEDIMDDHSGITPDRILSGVWKHFAVRGAVAVAFGLLLLVWPGIGLSGMVGLVGAFALASGLVSGGAAFALPAQSRRQRLWLAFDAITGVAIGAAVLVWPGLSAVALLYVIAAWAIALGGIQLTGSIVLPLGARGSLLLALNGIVFGAFGTVMFVAPGTGAVALVGLVAAFAIVGGAFDIAIAVDLRRALETLERRAQPALRPGRVVHG
jgi:uncharacterized membrane protein HdeD (DUF308 family)